MISASGALFELHRSKAWDDLASALRLRSRLLNFRERQIRRALRAQRFVVFLLTLREHSRLLSLIFRGYTIYPGQTKTIVNERGSRSAILRLPSNAVAVRFRRPEQFATIYLSGKPFVVRHAQRFMLWHILDLTQKLN